jgi:hypothetical protein
MSCYAINPLKPKKRERDLKDSKRVEAKRKCWGISERHFISAEEEGRERASYS